ncbi:unannotated protein [freshwater metagenome]|uniref:Unannotated protein n=1 Tax=freshwater metagenome TaxID=449393 RepID=A0A6J6PA26_9ZZZZ
MPTRRPSAINSRVIIRDVEPLPLVPVTWMMGKPTCGLPSNSMNRRMRSSDNSTVPVRPERAAHVP